MTSKELAIRLLGAYSVQEYEDVKRLYMVIGDRMPAALLRHVGGRVARAGEGCDGITRLGKWEFTTQRNSKKGVDDKHDRERCPGRCVQVFERPRPGWMSGVQFLSLHGVQDAEQVFHGIKEAVADSIRIEQQMRFPI